MIIGHLPAGYLVARLATALGAPSLFWGLMSGSIAPDFDMLRFYQTDNQATHYHDYVTHRPVIWLGIFGLGCLVRQAFVLGLGLGGVLLLVLDSIAGKVAWLWPFSDGTTTLVIVPATQDHWVLSFLVHWTFGVEIVITCIAIFMWAKPRKGKKRET